MPVGGALLLAGVAGGMWQVVKGPELRPRLYRLSALIAMAVAVAAPRIWLDRDVNGDSAAKAAKVLAAAEQHGEVRFKPSTLKNDPASSYPGRNLAAKGVSLGQVLGEPYNWTTQSWRSSLGVYGYMNAFAPDWLYLLISAGMMLCFAGVARLALRDRDFRVDLCMVGCASILVLLSSLIHSWAYDFQPQGRYLMPIAALIAALALAHPVSSRSRLIGTGIAISYLGSVLSFLFFAIPVLASR